MTSDTITEIKLEELFESPFNPRKTFTDIEALAADIRSVGRVVQPLLVRPRTVPMFADDPDGACGFEIVFGHRRYRAAELAGLATVPCMVRALTEAEARRWQISENLQRVDVHPIEEAEGFKALLDDGSHTADELAENMGKSRSYVYGRLKLLQAVPEVRKACLAGEIGSETALLVSRLHSPKLQEKALGFIRGKGYSMSDGGAKSYRQIRELLAEHFTLDLGQAMFNIEDEMLVPLAGHCLRCPKRTGNAPEYADLAADREGYWKGHDIKGDAMLCTDPECFDAKKKAHLKNQAAALEAKGKTVVDGNKARIAISATGEVKGGYIKLADVKDALKATGNKADTVLIQDPRTGKTVEAITEEAAKKAGLKVKAQPTKQKRPDYEAERIQREAEYKRQEEHARAETAFRTALLTQVRAAVASTARSAFDLRLIAPLLVASADWQDLNMLAELHGFKNGDQLEKKLDQLDDQAITLLMLDCALIDEVRVHPHGNAREPVPLLKAAKHYGVDVDALRASMSQASAQATPTPSKAARAPVGGADNSKAAPAKKTKAKGKNSPTMPAVAGGSDAQADAFAKAGAS